MFKKRLLEGIWEGSVNAMAEGEAGRIAKVIADIAPVPTICLVSATDLGNCRVLTESTELMPGVSLGDVIAEELKIDVPYGALIVLEKTGDEVLSPAEIHNIEHVLDRILHDLVVASHSNSKQATVASAAAMQAVMPQTGFRDHGLNARFFRAADARKDELLAQRAAG